MVNFFKKPLLIILSLALVLTLYVNPGKVDASIDLDADAAILIDAESGKILYQKSIDSILPIASMTKMMSQYLIFEAVENGTISWDQEVPISEFVRDLSRNTTLSNVYLRQDFSYTVRDLYESVTIYSANASMIALTELIAGSESEFVRMMNAKAEELGLTDYEFVNSTGLNNSDLNGNHPEGTGADAENVMSARATAQLAYHLVNDYPEVLETASIPKKEFTAHPEDEAVLMENWNWMVSGIKPDLERFAYDGIEGLKTGSTSTAGAAFTGVAKRGDIRLISVVMRTPTREARFVETAKLLDHGFNHFSKAEIVDAGYAPEGLNILEVAGGKEKEVTVSTVDSLSTIVRNGEEDLYATEIVFGGTALNENGEVVAPFEAGTEVGTLSLVYTGEEEEEFIYTTQRPEVAVVTNEAVEKAGWFSMTMRSIGGFFAGIWNGVADAVKGLFS
ncbi:D-alanyl-D-alanine carboxypeptidase [Halalkalibacter wakoensis JCM 9140]|uniref:serine-type D-Ala-D-Ala carboxypeptidase n=1 Tax=Halalkalibacter wakoensis JCM 9140 TaxID=1236970 RepID=W4Q9B4_9BACI|nr:D-alanyl-D-alanine carboxypeptidase family protein [Halalkalibacter wakoensis]GAE28268.1 D-alanyl-D-alanine carboxypeptidase [Halalkalibacter wakoensis JCM 9140]